MLKAVPASGIRELFAPCVASMKKNVLPGLVLQGFALLIILGYYFSESVAQAINTLGELKLQYGYFYSGLSTALCGGLIPYFVLLAAGQITPKQRLRHLLFYIIFWIIKGIEVDALYRAQALAFGDGNSLAVIATKVFFDQFGYNPLWAAPTQVLGFLWKDCDFSIEKTRLALVRQPFVTRYLTVLLSTWVVWIPAVALVYTLPSPLQIPLFNIVLCFWTLLLSYISLQTAKESKL